MARRIDRDTAHRRAAAPSIDFSMLPQSPDLQALRDEIARLRDEERAKLRGEDPSTAAQAAAPAPPPPADPPQRSPYRGRDESGRTLQPLDPPTARQLAGLDPFIPPAPAAGPGGAPVTPAPGESAGAPMPTSARAAAAPPLPPPPPARQATPAPPLVAAAPPPPPPVVLPPGATAIPLSDDDLRGRSAASPDPDHPLRQSQIPTLDLPRPPRDHRAVFEPAVTRDHDDEPAWVPPSPELAALPPSADRHATLVSQPPDEAFFNEGAPVAFDDIEDDIQGWERRRWVRRALAFGLVASLMLALLGIASIGAYTLYAETASNPMVTPPAAAPQPSVGPPTESTPATPPPPEPLPLR
jgi:hypothetical protein